MVREELDVLDEAVGVRALDRVHDGRVQRAPSLGEHAAVRDLVRERVLERVLEIGVEPRLVEKLRGLQLGERLPELVVPQVRHRFEQAHRDVLADDRGGLEQPLPLGPKPIDPRGEDGLHGGGNLDAIRRASEPIAARIAAERAGLHQRAHAFFEEERIALRAGDEERLQRCHGRVVADERVEQLVGARSR